MPTTLVATASGNSVQPTELLGSRLLIANDGPSRVHVAIGRPATLADTAIVPMMWASISDYQRGQLLYAIAEVGTASLRISSPPVDNSTASGLWIQPGAVAQPGAAAMSGGGALGAGVTYSPHN